MNFHLVHFYPDLMNLYGSYANVSVLRRYLEALGGTVTVESVVPGAEPVFSAAPDFIFMGAGTERAQQAALQDVSRWGSVLRDAAEAEIPMLFCGTAMDLLGRCVTDADGVAREGLGLGDFTCTQTRTRRVEDILGHTDLYAQPVVGFINSCSVFSEIATPFLSDLSLGGKKSRTEGFRYKHLLASHLTGPILVKNPRLLDTVADWICQQRCFEIPQPRPTDPWAEAGYQITAEQLQLRCGAGRTAG